MNAQVNAFRLLIPVAILLTFAGCGGGGAGLSSGSGIVKSNQPPVVQGLTWSPSDNPLESYRDYTFTANAVDPDLGDTIASYEWDFSDGTPIQTTLLPSAKHAFLAVATQVGDTRMAALNASMPTGIKIRATDNRGLAGAWQTMPVAISSAASPLSISYVLPSSAINLKTDTTGGVECQYLVRISDSAGGQIGLSRIQFSAGPNSQATKSPVDNGDGTYTFSAKYLGDIIPSTRTVNAIIQAYDSLGYISDVVKGPTVTVQTLSTPNRAPVIGITDPSTPAVGVYTSLPAKLVFTLSDPDGDVVNYSVDWGDGTSPVIGSVTGDTVTGVETQLQHTFPDSFTSGTKASVVSITATDGRSPNGVANPQSRTFNVTRNAFPTAAILTPQASGALPTPQELPSDPSIGFFNPPVGNDAPDIIVVPNFGKLGFAGSCTGPGVGTGTLVHSWTFQGGIPSTADVETPAGEVTFSAPIGQYAKYLVEYQVQDEYGRWSSSAPNVAKKTFRKWIVVDGKNTQLFKMSFMYRQVSDNNGVASLTPAQLSDNGLGALVQVYQDGINNTYAIQDQAMTKAVVEIPVRSNLPFYIKIPSFNSTDHVNYMMRIPNAPTGLYADPTLVSTNAPTGASTFTFENTNPVWDSEHPWNPTLHVVTAQGFASETQDARERKFQGLASLYAWYNGTTLAPNERWLDRLSVPFYAGDPQGAFQWRQSGNFVGTLNDIRATQSFAEWPILMLTIAPKDIGKRAGGDSVAAETKTDPFATAGKNTDLGFIVNYEKFQGNTQKTETVVGYGMQAYRVPGSNLDPYRLSSPSPLPNWNESSAVVDLRPLPVSATVPAFYQSMIYNPASSGGICWTPLPYDPNDAYRTPLSTLAFRNYSGIKSVFSYSEYLWSKVWARPLVLNHANLNWADTLSINLPTWNWFRFSNPVQWPAYPLFPSATGIPPDNSAFDLTTSGAGVFDNSSPVAIAPTQPSNRGVGRFYWTAYTPFYYGDETGGSLITRTWLADGTTLQPPDAYTPNPLGGDATSALGIVPPQDATVDKRSRDANGHVIAGLDGFRVWWFNPTKDTLGNTVPPDFWVLEMRRADGTLFHYMLPANFPATQTADSVILTDARTYLPSGNLPTVGPAVGDVVAPGYCWADIPLELRASLTDPSSSTSLTVFAIKTVHRSGEAAGVRSLNRPDWIDAIKTVSATVALSGSGGIDLAYAHKIPFNYHWDIVVANSSRTLVAP